MKRLRLATVAVLAAALVYIPLAYAGGLWEQLPAASLPLSGSETIPQDTNLSGGVNPQTNKVSTANLRNAMFSNSGTLLGSAPTTATATAGAATVASGRFTITSEALITAAGADYVLTVTNTHVLATSVVLCSAANGTNTTEGMAINRVQPSAGSLIVRVRNTHATVALNGTIKVNCLVVN